MKAGIAIGAFAIAATLLAYFLNFNEGAGLSARKDEWADFGTYVSGITLPFLTFITMCLLIRSLNLQQHANEGLVEQNESAKELNKRQGENETLRSFESSFYSLTEVARKEFERFKITISDGTVYRGAEAVSVLESLLERYAEQGRNQAELDSYFDSLDENSSMGIFSIVRSFYILFKVTVETCPFEHRDRYIDICTYSMPVKLINIVCLAEVFADWDNLELLRDFDFFLRPGVDGYVADWMRIRCGNDLGY